jgi:hypothetical protein
MPQQKGSFTPRNFDFERKLCGAISKAFRVRLQYDDDHAFRLFEPYAVYESTANKVLVVGQQIENLEKPYDRFEPRNFEVAKIRSLSISETTFSPNRNFNPQDKRYANGFICRIK